MAASSNGYEKTQALQKSFEYLEYLAVTDVGRYC